jgi:hypothetical protein
MKKAWAILAVVFVVALSVAAAAALRRDTGKVSLPTAIVTKTTFIDFLQLRGEVRPVRSVVLTAPSPAATCRSSIWPPTARRSPRATSSSRSIPPSRSARSKPSDRR